MSLVNVSYLHFQPGLTPYSFFKIKDNSTYSSETVEELSADFIKDNMQPLVNWLEKDKGRKVNLLLTIPVVEAIRANEKLFKRFETLLKSERIELLAGAGYNSLSALFSKELFKQEVNQHLAHIKRAFGVKSSGFVNSALIYSEQIGEVITGLGFKYAVVPRIPWFISEKSNSVFKSGSGKLKLVLPKGNSESHDSGQISVALDFGIRSITQLRNNDQVLLAELSSKNKLPVYNLPDLVASDNDGEGINYIIGNNLQRDFLGRLKDLSRLILACNDDRIVADFFWIASLSHFKSLGNNNDRRHDNYTSLLNMLYDIEIRLR